MYSTIVLDNLALSFQRELIIKEEVSTNVFPVEAISVYILFTFFPK